MQVRGDLRNIGRDPKDDIIIEGAVRANAEIIVSGDKDLLALGRYRSVHVLTPRQYVEKSLTVDH